MRKGGAGPPPPPPGQRREILVLVPLPSGSTSPAIQLAPERIQRRSGCGAGPGRGREGVPTVETSC